MGLGYESAWLVRLSLPSLAKVQVTLITGECGHCRRARWVVMSGDRCGGGAKRGGGDGDGVCACVCVCLLRRLMM